MKKLLVLAVAASFLLSCNDKSGSATATTTADDSTKVDSPEAKEERNKQTALSSVKAFDGETSADEVLKDADKDVIDYGSGEMEPMKGVDTSKTMLQSWLNAIPDYKGSDFNAVADGDYVFVYGTWTGTWKNNFMGQDATRKSFKVKDVDIFKFNDAGKIVEHRGIQSMNEVARQIGMKMK
jgi:predicted ester cyclase